MRYSSARQAVDDHVRRRLLRPTIDNAVLSAVSEPGAYALALAGLMVLGIARKRRTG